MKVLVTGAGGMLGQDLLRAFGSARDRHEVTSATRAELDVTDETAVEAAVAGKDVVVNAAAWTRVDDAETKEAQAFTVNAVGATRLAAACAREGARLVQISTDYVFAGDAAQPYAEDAPLAPRSAYGRTKAAGEWGARASHDDVLVVRTAWLYGAGGGNFVKTMARLSGERETVSVVDDQRGQPTTTRDLSRFVVDLVQAQVPAGVYHGTSEGETTWWGLARAVFEELGLDPGRVETTTSAAFSLPAPRPAYSVLGHDRTKDVGVSLLPDWREALAGTVFDVVGARA